MAKDMSIMEVQRAPDCDIKAASPLRGMEAANEAFMGVMVSMSPRQFGPSMGI